MELRIKRLVYDAVFLSCALMLSYLEFAIPPLLPIPGLKLGLCNLIIMLVARTVSLWDAAIISLLRVACTALLFGSVTSFWFSLIGACLAWLVLLLCTGRGCPFSIIGVSVLSAAAHQLGQILAACAIFSTFTFLVTYLPILLLVSMLTGSLTGWLVHLLSPRFTFLSNLFKKGIRL